MVASRQGSWRSSSRRGLDGASTGGGSRGDHQLAVMDLLDAIAVVEGCKASAMVWRRNTD
jgi:hypothetical protein